LNLADRTAEIIALLDQQGIMNGLSPRHRLQNESMLR
jgi:hypothetical protein